MQQLKVTRKLDVSGATLVGFGPPVWGIGKAYYVDSTSWGKGSDNNSGLDPSQPLAKIQTALGYCTAGANDYVIILNAWDNDLATITVAKNQVHIIGVSCRQHSAPAPWIKINGDGTAPVFTLTGGSAQCAEIAGLSLAADSTHACIVIGASTGTYGSYAHLHDLAFANSTDSAYLAQDGINIANGREANGLLVSECDFGDQLTRDGIRIDGGMSGGRIQNCYFTGFGGVGVNHTVASAVSTMPDVLDCRFRQAHGASEGWAITIQNSTGGLIDGNHASADFTTADANPYLDHTDKSQWGLNYNVITVTAPATT